MINSRYPIDLIDKKEQNSRAFCLNGKHLVIFRHSEATGGYLCEFGSYEVERYKFENMRYNEGYCDKKIVVERPPGRKNKKRNTISMCQNKLDLTKVDASESVIDMIRCTIGLEGVDRHNNLQGRICSRVYCTVCLLISMRNTDNRCPNCRTTLTYDLLFFNINISTYLSKLKYKKSHNEKVGKSHSEKAVAFGQSCQQELGIVGLICGEHSNEREHIVTSMSQVSKIDKEK